MNENIKGISVINTDFLAYDFKDQKFDLVLMNPPFISDGFKFIDKATDMSETQAFIIHDVWRGASGKRYRASEASLVYVKWLESGPFPVSTNLIITSTSATSTYKLISFNGNTEIVDKDMYNLPELSNISLVEYKKTFGFDGLPVKIFDYRNTHRIPSITGILFENKDIKFVKEYTPEGKHNPSYIDIKDSKDAEHLVIKLKDLMSQGVISYYRSNHRVYMDPIKG